MKKVNTKPDQRAKYLVDRAAWHEETRFAKRQLWAVTAAGLALLGGFLAALPSLRPLKPYEKWLGAFFAAAIWIGCFYFLRSLRGHLARTRTKFGEKTESAAERGHDIFWLLVGALAMGVVFVWYALYRDPTTPIFMWLAGQ
jgi:hypothetical protein